MNLKQCPCCKEESLIYSQNADINFELKNGKLIPKLGTYEINWMDRTDLWCLNCSASCEDSQELYDLRKEYEKLV